MKENRTAWAFVVFAAVLLGAIYFWRKSWNAAPPPSSDAAQLTTQNASTTPATVQPPAVANGVPPQPVPMVQAGPHGELVPVADGKTLDMSSGRAVVRDDAHSRAVIEQGLKEMEDAAASVTFGPRSATPPPAEKKKAEPPPAPPKS